MDFLFRLRYSDITAQILFQCADRILSLSHPFITAFWGAFPVGRQTEGRCALADTLDMPRRTLYDDGQIVLLGNLPPSILLLLKRLTKA